MAVLIETKGLKKYFQTPKGALHAVDDVSITIEKGETLGIVGESGCGKSTLGRTIIQLLNPTDGEVIFNGRDITKLSKKEFNQIRGDLQIIFQDPYSSIDPRKTIRQTIEEPLRVSKRFTKAEIAERVDDLMELVGLEKRLWNAYPHELDGGRRQRVCIARAIALDPQFIVCDEPVSALDVSIQAQVLNLLKKLQIEKGLTYMFVTHDMSVVKHISDNICVMYLGQVVEKSPSKELFKKPLHPYTQALLDAIPSPDVHNVRKREILHGELLSPINPEPGCRFAARCKYATDDCRQSQKLVEMFPNHFVACCRASEINQD